MLSEKEESSGSIYPGAGNTTGELFLPFQLLHSVKIGTERKLCGTDCTSLNLFFKSRKMTKSVLDRGYIIMYGMKCMNRERLFSLKTLEIKSPSEFIGRV